MIKSVYLQLALLLGIMACNSSKGTVTIGEKLSADDAAILYKAHSIEVKAGRRSKHPCPSEGHIFKYLVVPKEDIEDHLHIKLYSLPDYTEKHNGVRIYPYLPNKTSTFMIVYTKADNASTASAAGSDSVKKYYDDKTTFRIMKMSLKKEYWCELKKKNMVDGNGNKSNHKLCDPDCPESPSLPF